MKYKFSSTAVALSLFAIHGNSFAIETAGKTMIAKGQVSANDQDADRKLKRRSPIYNVDTITTSEKSKAQFRMTDGGMVSLQANSTLLIAEYEYDQEANTGSVVLELVEGGLRSVTGAIKSNNGSYELKTPVGSIGIRGTHYEVEIIEGDMFLAVWDGAIDVTVETPSGEEIVGFGDGEDYSFGIVSEEGEVTPLLEAPENFSDGHTSDSDDEASEENDDTDDDGSDGEDNAGDNNESDNEEESDSSENSDNADGSDTSDNNQDDNSENEQPNSGDQNNSGTETETDDNDVPSNQDQSGNDPDIAGNTDENEDINSVSDLETDVTLDTDTTNNTQTTDETVLPNDETINEEAREEIIEASIPALPDFIQQRSGTFTYDNVIDSSITSSLGNVSNFALSMNVDFDTTFTDGQLSFDDAGGEWFAAFNGAIEASSLNLSINFASHGNFLADGSIGGIFTNEGNNISGSFNLTDETGETAGGSFLIE